MNITLKKVSASLGLLVFGLWFVILFCIKAIIDTMYKTNERVEEDKELSFVEQVDILKRIRDI